MRREYKIWSVLMLLAGVANLIPIYLIAELTLVLTRGIASLRSQKQSGRIPVTKITLVEFKERLQKGEEKHE